ncbi:MAG: hypothetical protein KatS3mg027_0680 [Bacteroidia bacterium]|nr:MAG: hypothetical protein KatS3mg027_0680 [Bacteroidia bacterium]
MKKVVLGGLIMVVIYGLFSFKVKYNYEPKVNTAEVDQYEGLYVFVDSKPVREYEYLGTEKVVLTFGSGQYRDIRDKLIKKVKKEYPQANGIIFHFNENASDKADAIKIK